MSTLYWRNPEKNYQFERIQGVSSTGAPPSLLFVSPYAWIESEKLTSSASIVYNRSGTVI